MGIKDRVCFGNHCTFIPTGKPVYIGPKGKSQFDAVEDYGEQRGIKIVVGQNKGRHPKNNTGSCAASPKKFSAVEIDREFIALRSVQVGKKNVGATRVAGEGWYEGEPEDSITYDIVFIPNDREIDFEAFSFNVDDLALALAERFCQDEVLILRDDGTRRTVAGAKWEPELEGD